MKNLRLIALFLIVNDRSDSMEKANIEKVVGGVVGGVVGLITLNQVSTIESKKSKSEPKVEESELELKSQVSKVEVEDSKPKLKVSESEISESKSEQKIVVSESKPEPKVETVSLHKSEISESKSEQKIVVSESESEQKVETVSLHKSEKSESKSEQKVELLELEIEVPKPQVIESESKVEVFESKLELSESKSEQKVEDESEKSESSEITNKLVQNIFKYLLSLVNKETVLDQDLIQNLLTNIDFNETNINTKVFEDLLIKLEYHNEVNILLFLLKKIQELKSIQDLKLKKDLIYIYSELLINGNFNNKEDILFILSKVSPHLQEHCSNRQLKVIDMVLKRKDFSMQEKKTIISPIIQQGIDIDTCHLQRLLNVLILLKRNINFENEYENFIKNIQYGSDKSTNDLCKKYITNPTQYEYWDFNNS